MSCAICLEKFDLFKFKPQLLIPCNHTICSQCYISLQNIIEININCPICHDPITNSIDNERLMGKVNLPDDLLSNSDQSSNFSYSFESKSSLESSQIETSKVIHNINNRFLVNDKNSPQSLLKAGRIFLLEGVFLKECKKRSKIRHFFLFNDILVYGKKHPIFIHKLTSQHILTLQDMQIKTFKSNNTEYAEGIFILHSKKSFAVFANSTREHNEWFDKLTKCVNELKTKYSRNLSENKSLAPIWTPDQKAKRCMSCDSIKFNLFNRRHHCRLCGNVICTHCSKNKSLLSNISEDEPVRVCIKCFESKKY